MDVPMGQVKGLIIACGVLILGVLAGCGGSPTPATAPVTSPPPAIQPTPDSANVENTPTTGPSVSEALPATPVPASLPTPTASSEQTATPEPSVVSEPTAIPPTEVIVEPTPTPVLVPTAPKYQTAAGDVTICYPVVAVAI